jgi:hypothetical protein
MKTQKTSILFIVFFFTVITSLPASVIELVPVNIGQSEGRLGSAGNPLHGGDKIGLKIVLNHNPYPANSSYDGFLLSSMDLDLHVLGPGCLDVGTRNYIGNPVWKSVFAPPWFIINDNYLCDGLDQIYGVTLTPIQGPVDLVWDLILTCDGSGPIVLDLTLNGLSEYAQYSNGSGQPLDTWRAMTEQDLGDLILYVVGVPDPSIEVTDPNADTFIVGGLAHTIRWTDDRYINACSGDYILDYSIDNGQNWLPVDTNIISGVCSYDWTVPVLDSETSLIRITDYHEAMNSDTTDTPFWIYQCKGPMAGDIDGDTDSDLRDFALLALQWGNSSCGNCSWADPSGDQNVDTNDLTMVMADWLNSDAIPQPCLNYRVGDCNSLLQPPGDPMRYAIKKQGNYIHLEDLVDANSCADEIKVDVVYSSGNNHVTFYESQLVTQPCQDNCGYPLEATYGPLPSGLYFIDVVDVNGTMLGANIMSIGQ